MNTERSTDDRYVTTEQLATIIKYDARTIRERLKDSVLLEDVHYFRPFGGRKILYIREAVERDMRLSGKAVASIPMASGVKCRG